MTGGSARGHTHILCEAFRCGRRVPVEPGYPTGGRGFFLHGAAHVSHGGSLCSIDDIAPESRAALNSVAHWTDLLDLEPDVPPRMHSLGEYEHGCFDCGADGHAYCGRS